MLELLPTVGPLALNEEISARWETDLATNLVFYTDNNGLELQRRVTYAAPLSFSRIRILPGTRADGASEPRICSRRV
jgi:hypothetical protein